MKFRILDPFLKSNSYFLSGLSIAHKDEHIVKKHFKIELDEKNSNFEIHPPPICPHYIIMLKDYSLHFLKQIFLRNSLNKLISNSRTIYAPNKYRNLYSEFRRLTTFM